MKRFAAVLIAALCVLVPVSASIDPAVAGLLGYPVTFSGYPALSGDELYGEDVLPIALGALISGTDIHFQDFISGDEDTIAAALLDLILLEAETGNFEVYASRGLIIPSITDSRGRIGYDISYIDFSFAYSTDEKAGSFEIDGNVYGWVDSSDEILLSIAVGTDGIRIGDEAYDASEFRIDIFFDKAVADDFFGHFGISPEEAIAAIADESDYDIPEADFDRLAYPAAFIISVIEYTEDYSLLLPAFRAEVYQDGIPADADIAASLGIYLSLAEGYI